MCKSSDSVKRKFCKISQKIVFKWATQGKKKKINSS